MLSGLLPVFGEVQKILRAFDCSEQPFALPARPSIVNESLVPYGNEVVVKETVSHEKKTGEVVFFDCSVESPAGRRSFCYDREALDSRKENKPKNCVMDAAEEMGTELLNEEEYRLLQRLGHFDAKTSSWIATPAAIRKLGGALFADYRYDTVFVYHNGAESYYAARGFRVALRV